MNDIHNKDKQLSRQQSGSQSKSNNEMKGHYNRYTTVKSFDCTECGKKFATKFSLKHHINGKSTIMLSHMSVQSQNVSFEPHTNQI